MTRLLIGGGPASGSCRRAQFARVAGSAGAILIAAEAFAHGADAGLSDAASTSSFAGASEQAGAGQAGEGGGGASGAALATPRTVDELTPDAEGDEDTSPGAGAELDVATLFLWRGMALSHGPVLQPSAWASYYGVSAGVWLNLLLPAGRRRAGLSALEPELAYESRFGWLKFRPSVTGYWMRDESSHQVTAEVGLEMTAALVGPFAIRNTHQVDIDANPGAYFGEFGPVLTSEQGLFTFGARLQLDYATAPFNSAYFGRRVAALDALELGLDARRTLGSDFYTAAHAALSTLLPASLASDQRHRTLFQFGLLVGWEL